MDSATHIVKYLYSDFILRDVFAKMVPGAIVFFAILLLERDSSPRTVLSEVGDWHIAIILVSLGICWLLGFAAQETGRILRIRGQQRIGRWLLRKRCANKIGRQLLRIPDTGVFHPQMEVTVETLIKLARFKSGSNDDYVKSMDQMRERHTVVKEATGNLAVGLFFLLVVLCVRHWGMGDWEMRDLVPFLAAIPVMIAILLSRHWYMAGRQKRIDEKILKYLESKRAGDKCTTCEEGLDPPAENGSE